MGEDGRPLTIVRDVTSRFATIEAEIDGHIAESRRWGKHSLAAMVAFVLCAAALAVLSLRGLWPPKAVQVPTGVTVSDRG